MSLNPTITIKPDSNTENSQKDSITTSDKNQQSIKYSNEDKKSPINNDKLDKLNYPKTSDEKLNTINSNPNSNKKLSLNAIPKTKNAQELEKYIQRLKKINIKDKDTQNLLKKSYSIINSNESVSNMFKNANEILKKVNQNNNSSSSNNDNAENKPSNLLSKLPIHDLVNLNLIDKTTEITDISRTFANENIKKIFEENYFKEVKKLNTLVNSKIENLENILATYKSLETDFNEITKGVNKKENEIESMLTFNNEFYHNNKNFLIRNEILRKFLQKVIMSKEEKDNLLKKNLYDEKFFLIIKKLFEIKYSIKILERNSEKFSKNLIFSIKENFNIMDDLMNEKIVLYVKEVLRTSEKFFANKNLFNSANPQSFYYNLHQEFAREFNIDNWIIALSYIAEKENYKTFIIKEYVNSRKRIIENTLKQKYMKINKIEVIFDNLTRDAEIFYIKEFLLFQVFFGNSINVEANVTSSPLSIPPKPNLNGQSEENSNESETELRRESSKNLFFEENLLNLNNKEKKILYDLYFNSFYFSISQADEKANEDLNYPSKASSNTKLMSFFNPYSKEVKEFTSKLIEDLIYIQGILKPKFSDTNFSINYLNQILYVLEELYYDNVRFLMTTKNLEKDMNENYKMLLLSDVFEQKIDCFFTKNEALSQNFDFALKIKNNSINIINLNKNYKKQFANNSVRLFNENFKFLQKINRAAFDLLFETENSVSNASSENSLIKSYYTYMDDYFRLFSDYKNYISSLSSLIDNKELEASVSNLNPRNQNAFKLLTEFFNQDSFKSQRNKNLILRTLNLLNSFLLKFKAFDEFLKDELSNVNRQIEYFKGVIVEVYFEEILKLTEFDKNLEKIISHEQAINLIQLILEKSQVAFADMGILTDFSLRDAIKDNVKNMILKIYREKTTAENIKIDFSFINENEFKNYIDLI